MIDQDEKLLNKVYKITRGLSIDENLLKDCHQIYFI